MRTHFTRQDGFTLTELLISTTIMLLVVGGAMTTFKNALSVNDAATQLSDSNQNLRAGTNLLVHDLLQAGRSIPTGGISIPNGSGSHTINRTSPPGASVYTFNNTTQTTLMAITTGANLGPTIDASSTDMVTIIGVDPLLPVLSVFASGATLPTPAPALTGTIANSGASITLTASNVWLTGDVANGVSPIKIGDLVFFSNGVGTTVQTVTRVDTTTIYFDADTDWFDFNQPAAAAGNINSLKSGTPAGFSQTQCYRLIMTTYYVDATTTPGSPKLTRVINHFTPQALAGVVEDLDLSYDLVDGVNNPTQVKSLPYTDSTSGLTYSSNQIRKVNLHVGVRSDMLSVQQNDYIRNHVSTAISIRDLAYVDRYK